MALTPLISWSSLVSRVAFCTWIISNILFSMPVLVYGGYMFLVTGAFVIFSLLSFSTVRNSPMCVIQIGTRTLHVAYGVSFWLVLAIGKNIRVPQVKSVCPSVRTRVPVLPSQVGSAAPQSPSPCLEKADPGRDVERKRGNVILISRVIQAFIVPEVQRH